MTPHEDPHRHLPLTPHSFQILLSLLDQEMHGYSIIKDIEARTEGEMILGTSTVYAAVKRMVLEQLLEEVPPQPGDASAGPRRKYYGLTELGARILASEAARLTDLVAMPEVVALARQGR